MPSVLGQQHGRSAPSRSSKQYDGLHIGTSGVAYRGERLSAQSTKIRNPGEADVRVESHFVNIGDIAARNISERSPSLEYRTIHKES